MVEINFSISETMIDYAILAACVLGYTIAGAITMAVCVRTGCTPDTSSNDEDVIFTFMAGASWPLVSFGALVYLAYLVSWWTLLIPARLVYRVIRGGRQYV